MASKTRPAPRARLGAARVAIVRARWNGEVTLALARAAAERAAASGATVEQFEVAGSFELPAAIALLADSGRYDAIVPLGCLVRGETAHFDVLAHAVARAIADLSVGSPAAIPFGVLTCDTMEQALARAGGSAGNRGADFMDAALELVDLRRRVTGRARPRRSRARRTS